MKVVEITSEHNETFRWLLKLSRAGGIKKSRAAVLSGPKQVRDVLRDFPEKCAGVLFSDRMGVDVSGLAAALPRYRMARPLFRQIDLFETGRPLLLVRADPFPPWAGKGPPEGCILCVPFQDPANVGAVVRTAAAFGVRGVVLLKEAAHPFLPKALRASGGAVFTLPLFNGPMLGDLKAEGVPVIVLAPEGERIDTYPFPPAFCLVPGLEGQGIPERLGRAVTLSIPMEPGVESLNAALAAGIALYAWRSGRVGGASGRRRWNDGPVQGPGGRPSRARR